MRHLSTSVNVFQVTFQVYVSFELFPAQYARKFRFDAALEF